MALVSNATNDAISSIIDELNPLQKCEDRSIGTVSCKNTSTDNVNGYGKFRAAIV